MCQSNKRGYEVRPDVIHPGIEAAYAEMALDEYRERVAMEWAETTMEEACDETWWEVEAGELVRSPCLFVDQGGIDEQL